MKHHHKPAAPAVEVARPQPQPHHHPVGYDIPSHLGKIFRSWLSGRSWLRPGLFNAKLGEQIKPDRLTERRGRTFGRPPCRKEITNANGRYLKCPDGIYRAALGRMEPIQGELLYTARRKSSRQ